MRPSTAVVSAFVVITGVAGGSVAYELASTVGPAGSTASEITAALDEEEATTVPRPRLRWAPCKAPAVLHGDTCVTIVVLTGVLPDTGAAASTASGRVAATPAYQDDDGDRDERLDDDGDRDERYDDDGDDDGDDDHEDEGYEDEGSEDHDEDD